MGATITTNKRRSNVRNVKPKINKTPEEIYSLWQKILAVSKNKKSTIADISAVVEQDHKLQQEVIKLARNAKHYNGHPVTSIEHAIMLIGVDRICSVVEERRKLKLSA